MLKRFCDLITSLCGIFILCPGIAIVAILVKLDSCGPAFCREYRVGRHGNEFPLYKFRTTIGNGHKLGPPIEAPGGPRITRVGRFLRRWRIDLIPQLLNVVKGDMSVVGPRPEDPNHVALYSQEHSQILNFRPGLTSPASVAYRDEEHLLHSRDLSSTYLHTILPAKLAVDLRYFQNETFSGDLAVIGRALAAVVGGAPPFGLVSALIRTRIPWLAVDAPIVAAGFYAALLLRFLDDFPPDQTPYMSALNFSLPPLIVVYAGMNYVWRLQRRVWRYASAPEVVAIFVACATSTVIAGLADVIIGQAHGRLLPVSVVLLGGFFTFTGMVGARYRWRLMGGLWRRRPDVRRRTRAVIYGAGDSGELLARRILTESGGAEHELVGFIDDNPAKQGLRIHNVPVLGTRIQLAGIVQEKGVDLIILAMSNIGGEELRTIVSSAQRTSAQIRIVPDWLESIGFSRPSPLVREVKVDDLLGRQHVVVDMPACSTPLKDRIVLVTGGAGSVGSELCRQIVMFAPRRLLVLDNNESALHDLEIELRALSPNIQIVSMVADVTDECKMDALFSEATPQTVFHAAAYKHVPLMERYPEEAVRVNVGGTLVTLEKARLYGTERFVLVSTDKAVNAESVMGATKRLAEMLVLEMQHRTENGDRTLAAGGTLVCTTVRFGNVLGSRGSVVPTFAKQIEIGGPVTVTHPEMTRYFMEISEAAALIIQAAALTQGGEIFMLNMGERIRVDDLARKMIRLRGLRPETDIPIVYVGMRPGEKLHEELTFPEEERVQTTHPHIYRLVGNSFETRPHLERAARALMTTASTGRREQLVEELMNLTRLANRGTLRAPNDDKIAVGQELVPDTPPLKHPANLAEADIWGR